MDVDHSGRDAQRRSRRWFGPVHQQPHRHQPHHQQLRLFRKLSLRTIAMKILSLLLTLGLLPLSMEAGISEPDTVFYGRIINRTTAEEYLLTQGTLTWVVSRPDGNQVTLTAALQPLNNGLYSYRLAVPHEALAYGLTVSSAAVPLGAQPAAC